MFKEGQHGVTDASVAAKDHCTVNGIDHALKGTLQSQMCKARPIKPRILLRLRASPATTKAGSLSSSRGMKFLMRFLPLLSMVVAVRRARFRLPVALARAAGGP